MIYLMRHGQDDETYIGGWSDVDLIDEGITQVKNTALWLRENTKIKLIRTSDVKRAVTSATIVQKELGVPMILDSSLREQSKGLLNGMIKEEALRKYPEFQDGLVTINTKYPNGESLSDLYARVREYLKKIGEVEDETLLVTHRGFINMLYYILNDIPLDMDKKKFKVTPATVHELDQKKLVIRKVR